MAMMTGPIRMPSIPNTLSPPSTAKKMSRSCILVRLPTSRGRSRLSEPPMTTRPQIVSTMALTQEPETASQSAAGTQTTKLPSMGMVESRIITIVHRSGECSPRHQNMNPPRPPWMMAITTTP